MSRSNFYLTIENPKSVNLNEVFDEPVICEKFGLPEGHSLRERFNEAPDVITDETWFCDMDDKWYSAEIFFRKLSEKFPSVKFTVEEHDTEDFDDRGKYIVQNGQVKRLSHEQHWRESVDEINTVYTLYVRPSESPDDEEVFVFLTVSELRAKINSLLNSLLEDKKNIPQISDGFDTIEDVIGWLLINEGAMEPLYLHAQRSHYDSPLD